MTTKVDLHVHTTWSDGRLSPVEVVQQAAQTHLRAIAISDHDVLGGISEAATVGKWLGVEVVPAIELTAFWGRRTAHLLGYFIDPTAPNLVALLSEAERDMAEHVASLIAEISHQGVTLPPSSVAKVHSRYPTGTSVVLTLTRQKLLRSLESPWPVLRLAARQPRTIDIETGIRVIHEAGGAAVLAHPARLVRGKPWLERDDFQPLIDAGLDGVEARTSAHRQETQMHYERVADRLGLAATGGSDFHGQPGRAELGQHGVSDAALDDLRRLARSYLASASVKR